MGMQDTDDLDPLPFPPVDHQMRPAGMDAHRRREFFPLPGHLFSASYAGKWVTVFEKAAYRGGCRSLPELPEGTIRL